MLSLELKQQIKEYVVQNPTVELCGLIVDSGDNTFIYKCKNIAQDSGKHFELNPFDYLRAVNNGQNKIVGMFHSQQSPRPSLLDVINCKNHKISSYIYSHESGEIFEVTVKHSKYNQYIGLPFEIGVCDCFSLVRSFYKQEYNILINNYHREDGWYKKNPNIIKENYKKEGFRILGDGDVLQEGDILEFFHTHFGIYLEVDLLLNHPRNKYSLIEKLDMSWKNRITNIYRFDKKEV